MSAAAKVETGPWAGAPMHTKAVFEQLMACALYMSTIFYEDLASIVGTNAGVPNLAPAYLAWPLGFIRDRICIPRGLPRLNMLVVSKSTWLPGECAIPRAERTRAKIDDVDYFRAEVARVYAIDWERIVL